MVECGARDRGIYAMLTGSGSDPQRESEETRCGARLRIMRGLGILKSPTRYLSPMRVVSYRQRPKGGMLILCVMALVVENWKLGVTPCTYASVTFNGCSDHLTTICIATSSRETRNPRVTLQSKAVGLNSVFRSLKGAYFYF